MVYSRVGRINNTVHRPDQFLEEDAIPGTLVPILATLRRHQFPPVLEVIDEIGG